MFQKKVLFQIKAGLTVNTSTTSFYDTGKKFGGRVFTRLGAGLLRFIVKTVS